MSKIYQKSSKRYGTVKSVMLLMLGVADGVKIASDENNKNEQQRSLQAVQDLRTYPETFFQTYLAPTKPQSATDDASSSSEAEAVLYYDIYNCPEAPPVGYPKEWNLVQDVLGSWPADEMEIQHTLHQGLCVFNYTNTKEYQTALRYRDAELPFVIRGDPAVAQTVERWNTPYYLSVRQLKSIGCVVRRTIFYNHKILTTLNIYCLFIILRIDLNGGYKTNGRNK